MLTADRITFLNLLTFLDPDLDDDARHWGTHGTRITGGFFSRHRLHGSVVIVNRNSTNLRWRFS